MRLCGGALAQRLLLHHQQPHPHRLLLFCPGLGSGKADARLVREWATRSARPSAADALQFKMMQYTRYGDPDHVWTVDGWAADIAAELGTNSRRQRVLAVCVSAGAQALLRALWHAPELCERVAGLLMVSPGVRMELANYVQRVLPAQRAQLEAGERADHPSTERADEGRIRVTLASLEDYARNCVLRRPDAQMPPMDFPIRIVHGIYDKLVPFRNSVELLERVPSREKALHLVPCGHMITDTATVLQALNSLWACINQKAEEEQKLADEAVHRRGQNM